MNTLVHPTPPPAAAGARPLPAIDLPSGPPPLQTAPAPVQADEATPRKTGLLTWLLAGTAVAGVLGLIGAGLVATLSRTGHPVPAPADWLGMPQAVSPQQSPVQPSQPAPAQAPPRNAPASTGTKNPFEPAGSPPALPAVVPAPTPVPAPAPRSSGDELRALKQSGPYARPAPSRSAAAAAAAASPAPAASAVQDAPASPPATGQQEPKAAPAAGSAADPARVAGAPTIDPAAPAPQSLVDMVAALADDIAQERRSDAELRKQIATLLHDTDQRLSDFDRRLTVAEAGVVPATARVGFGRASARSAPSGVLSAMRTVLAVPPPGARPYEIRAASPGVAVLGTLDGTPAVVEIAVGDQVPGYGRVNAIAQKGSAWAVQCEHGTIQ